VPGLVVESVVAASVVVVVISVVVDDDPFDSVSPFSPPVHPDRPMTIAEVKIQVVMRIIEESFVAVAARITPRSTGVTRVGAGPSAAARA